MGSRNRFCVFLDLVCQQITRLKGSAGCFCTAEGVYPTRLASRLQVGFGLQVLHSLALHVSIDHQAERGQQAAALLQRAYTLPD